MDKIEIVQDAAARLSEAEGEVERALTSAVRLMEALVLARRDLDLPEMFGDEPMHRAGGLIAALAEAKREATGVQGALGRVQAWIGAEPRAFAAPEPEREDSPPRAARLA